MDSINKQQPGENYKDLRGEEATKKIKELANSGKTCFFCTNNAPGQSFATRPMAVQKIDDDGNFWFLSTIDSHKNDELLADPTVQLLFQGASYINFMNIYGEATILKDKEKIKELWEPTMKVWFTEGVDDPRISVIKVEPIEGYYWDNKHGQAIALIKRLAGAAIGKTIDDSVEGKLKI